MSRVHDALRRAEQTPDLTPPAATPEQKIPAVTYTPSAVATNVATSVAAPQDSNRFIPATVPGSFELTPDLFALIKEVPFTPSPDAHLISLRNPHEAPAEEFRSLRTRLNHIQSTQPIYTLVVTSPSPAEGKSFAAVNLAIAEAQLEGNRTLLMDCDFRRPVVNNLFQIDRGPGITDFLTGRAKIEDCIKRISGTDLYVLPAGEAVVNPLELLNLREMKLLLDSLPSLFNWVIIDSPPLLFAADANLLSTLCGGTVLVVRIGNTTIDSVTRAMSSLCENNVLGIIVNGARRGELYSKYTYYHSYYTAKPQDVPEMRQEEEEVKP